jgi:hypothetical protein
MEFKRKGRKGKLSLRSFAIPLASFALKYFITCVEAIIPET